MSIGTSGGPLGYAYVRPLDVVSNINGRLAIPIKYHFPVGHGNSIKTQSALVKPFEKLMEEGKPHGQVAFVFYRENNSYFVLGSFALAHRIVFFPGLRFSRIVASSFSNLTRVKELDIQHITLEPDLRHWHPKLMKSEEKCVTQRTMKVDENTVLWLAMGVADVNKLEPLPSTQNYVLDTPVKVNSQTRAKEILEKRKQIMLDSVANNIFPVCEVNDNPSYPYFLNFEVFVSTIKTQYLEFHGWPFYIGHPQAEIQNMTEGIRSKFTLDFSPSDRFSIFIRTCKVKGSLNNDAFIYWPKLN